jgi:hypothetical protein
MHRGMKVKIDGSGLVFKPLKGVVLINPAINLDLGIAIRRGDSVL